MSEDNKWFSKYDFSLGRKLRNTSPIASKKTFKKEQVDTPTSFRGQSILFFWLMFIFMVLLVRYGPGIFSYFGLLHE